MPMWPRVCWRAWRCRAAALQRRIPSPCSGCCSPISTYRERWGLIEAGQWGGTEDYVSYMWQPCTGPWHLIPPPPLTPLPYTGLPHL